MKKKAEKNYIRVKKKSPQPANEKFTVFRKLTTKMSNRSWWSVKKKIFVKIEKSTNARQCQCMKMQFPALSTVINVAHNC